MPVPHFDVSIAINSIDADQLRVVWDDEAFTEGIGDNRAYMDMGGATWAQVEEVVEVESDMLRRAASQARNPAQFDSILRQLAEEQRPEEDEPDEDILFSSLFDLDVGVMSAVAALSAAGCVSTTSCRGHAQSGEPAPLVRFTADEQRLPLVSRAASAASCGLLLDNGGMLQLYAGSVLAFVDFGRQMLALSNEFSVISSKVEIPRLDHEALDALGMDVRRGQLRLLLEGVERETGGRHEGQQTLWDEA